jgi:hypothetical protein
LGPASFSRVAIDWVATLFAFAAATCGAGAGERYGDPKPELASERRRAGVMRAAFDLGALVAVLAM